MKPIMKFDEFVNEALKTKEIDPKQFPNPGKPNDTDFFGKGKKDGNPNDDKVKTVPAAIPAKLLKPSQDAVYLGKALGLAIAGVAGGELGAVISKDNRILDGHHRWAATLFNDPDAKIIGQKSDLLIGDLIPVLRQAGDALGNLRGTEPKGGDLNIFKATMDDVKACIYDAKNMDIKFYDKTKAIEWFESHEKEVENALKFIQKLGAPAGAPPRKDMPKIEPEQVDGVAKDLNKGDIDVRAPYAKESVVTEAKGFKNTTDFEKFLEEIEGMGESQIRKIMGKDYIDTPGNYQDEKDNYEDVIDFMISNMGSKEFEKLQDWWESNVAESVVSEKRITFNGKNASDLSKKVKGSDSPMIFVKGKTYSVDVDDLDGEEDVIFVTDGDGEEVEVNIKDIEFIEL